ncbi:MAG: hypothetical protein CVU56_16795 [Deltaproteobacteria bacterium HGW-Deltaproteobacteria-14]|nr:MAG: hypothetical protein CVU56_16795 [Deltaproteobacteria bacterium HGW-Deltaproteobacteria-14]
MKATAAGLTLVLGVVGCAGDPQRDLAHLCAAAEEVCPSDGCPSPDALEGQWRRALGRVGVDTDAGRGVREAAYTAPLGGVDEAVRSSVIAAGLTWDCPALARLDAAAVEARASAATLLDEVTALLLPGADPDTVVEALSHYISVADPRVDAVAEAMGDPTPRAKDGADAAAAKRLGDALNRLCKRSPQKCGAAAQACATLLTRLAPRDADGRSLLASPSGFPLMLDKAIDMVEDPTKLDARLSALAAPARARVHALFDGLLGAALELGE